MIINYKDIEQAVTHLSTAFEFMDGQDKVKVSHFEGDLYKMDSGMYYLKGKVEAVLHTVCDRCMEPAAIPIKGDISVNIEPAADHTISESEYEMKDVDGDIYATDPEYLDLNDIVRQEVILQFPSKKLCDENCKGIDNIVVGSETESAGESTSRPLQSLSELKRKLEEK